jgi:hypothetical protein
LPVRISEVVADNKFSLKDGYGEAPDWIELRNTGNSPVNLQGYGLSDNPAVPMKWIFPATNLPAHSMLIVFASGRSTPLDPAGNVHASFKLDKNGGAIFLTSSTGVTADSLAAYPELGTDLSYGRDLEGNWTFLEPTPGTLNTGVSYPGWLKPVAFSHARGFYDLPFALNVSNGNAGATVLCSFDGSTPSLPWTNGTLISGTRAVRVQAVRTGYKPAPIQTETFIFVDDVIASPVMSRTITQDPAYAPRLRPGLLALPSISICVPGQPEYAEKEGSVEILWPDGSTPFQGNCGVERFGNSWQVFAKRSFRLKGRAQYGDNKLRAPLFNGFDRGMVAQSSFDQIELRSGSQDMVDRGFYMAGRFVEDSMLDMGSLNPHGRFVHVYLNGVYWGHYDARETLEDHFLADYLGGEPEQYLIVRGNDNIGDDFVPGTPEPPNILPWERVRALRSSYSAVSPYLDVTHLIDFMLLWFYGNCESEYRACGPVDAGSGFKFWLADADGFLRTSALGLNRTANSGPGGLFGALTAQGHADLKALLADRIYRHFYNNGALTPAANDARLVARAQEVRDAFVAESARWPQIVSQFQLGVNLYAANHTPAGWAAAVDNIRSNLFPARTSQLLGYLRARGFYPSFDPPRFNQYGGLVTNGFVPMLSSTNCAIYYTLDGSDPRLAGGGLSAGALIWTPGALIINQDTLLSVRVRTLGGQWSALARPRFLLASRRAPGARDLLITEIHYNPAGDNGCEFVELYNASTNLLDLAGVSLSNAVRFIFPNGSALAPAQFVVIADNLASFARLYQEQASPWYYPGIKVAGEWTGALNNSGETLSLIASNGFELSSVSYRSGGDWPERADGVGSSMELATLPAATATDQDVRNLLSAGRSWKSSSLYHGSPGRFDAFAKAVRISEILSHTDLGVDWLELWNAGNQPVSLSGCALTDSMDRPNRWLFPTNIVLQPGQRVVLSSTGLGFAFSELGDSAFLLSMSDTNVGRFLDSVNFPAAERERSFGLYQRSDGEFDFTELRADTPGAANTLPLVGPVVISEIMATPEPGKAQFVEVTSITNIPVPLFDPLRPTNTWTVDGLGGFAFPQGITLQPCGSLILCSTNPSAFRAQYGLSPSVPVFGPWPGTLDTDGETLKILRPGDPEPDGTVPYYRVDHVSFRMNAPWPSSHIGLSLERAPVQAYGNDPVYWHAGPTNGTPGLPSASRWPLINISGVTSVHQNMQMTLTVSAVSLDAPWKTSLLSATNLPAGSTFDPSSGVFAWCPKETQGPAQYYVDFLARDDAACDPGVASLRAILQVIAPLALTLQEEPGGLQLTFPAVPGAIYRLEFCEDLAVQDWRPLQTYTGSVASPMVSQLIPFEISTNGTRFYRAGWFP